MESLIGNNQKRKKRKSRKHLNALRKKALQDVTVNDFYKGCDVKPNKRKSCTNKASIHITSKRLTLFNKAVTSETLSRTSISKAKDKEHVNIFAKIMSPVNKKSTKIFTTNNNDNEGQVKGYDVSCDSKNCNNVVLFSSLHQTNSDILDTFQNDKHQSDYVLPDSSSINNLCSVNKCYNDLMNEIPIYLKRTVPMLLNTDFVHKCKISLRNLYMENDHLSIKDSSASWSSSSYSSQESMIKNLTDYTEYSYQHVSEPESVSSPLVHPVSNSTVGLFSSPLSMVLDSPEYIYYPHKLNL